jgi:hypothetical protein
LWDYYWWGGGLVEIKNKLKRIEVLGEGKNHGLRGSNKFLVTLGFKEWWLG